MCRHLGDASTTLEAMLRPKVVALPGHIQSVFVQNILKLYAHIVTQAERRDDADDVTRVTALLSEKLPMFVASSDLEVQERVSSSSCCKPSAALFTKIHNVRNCILCAGLQRCAARQVRAASAGEGSVCR